MSDTVRTLPSFQELYGRPPAVLADAPGRVNLMGEHTDYNGGFVLPIAIPQRTRVELSPRSDTTARVASANVEPPAQRTYVVGAEARVHSWIDYVQGVTNALCRRGLRICGFDARIESTVPVGSGLSSSAALEVSILRALRQIYGLSLDDLEIAKAARSAETDFVMAPVGIMDQMASSLADERAALFIDTRTLEYERIAIPATLDLVVVDSGIAHDHATGDYRTRRAECERAASLLGLRELRDFPADRLRDLAKLPAPLDRRARHVVSENARVFDAAAALRENDLERLGATFNASHASMRDDFEVSVPAIDRLVERACATSGVYGARLTGGGFGGSIVVLAKGGEGRRVAERIVDGAPPGARALVPSISAPEAGTGRLDAGDSKGEAR